MRTYQEAIEWLLEQEEVGRYRGEWSAKVDAIAYAYNVEHDRLFMDIHQFAIFKRDEG